MEKYDVVILGCGPAGLASGIFLGRAGLNTCIIGIPEKSQAQMASNIENYFGFPEGVPGPELIKKGIEHVKKFGVKTVVDEVVSANYTESNSRNIFTVKTSRGVEMSSLSLVIATGVPIKVSGILNESKLMGKGIHYCVNCDGAMYKNKKLAIIGSGNHAAESAMEALSYSKDITIVANADSFCFSPKYQKEIDKWQIKTLSGKVKEFSGDKWLENLVMKDGRLLQFSGIFMACGLAGALDFAANLGLEIKDNILVVDESNMTSLNGVFAAGNCEGRCRQIAKNVGDGCNAAVNAIKYLRSSEVYMDYAHPSVSDAKPVARKLRIGWFSFSCCEDSTIVFTEMLNDYYDKWKEILDFAHVRVLKSKNDMNDLDIAFVEGAISSENMVSELEEIRKNSKKVVAIGSCAMTGMPSSQRNEFDERLKREIDPIVEAYKYRKNVIPIHDLVKVDDNVPGCPMTEGAFLAMMGRMLKEFGINA